ncbi:MAG: hypothetical protein OXI38_05410, partial [Bacteroidota bacterium]|nr:hypothetical protein [Bacteroidota bacterium]
MTSPADFFRKPATRSQIRYEALRAHFVEGLSLREAAARFGYTYGSFKNLCTAFRKNPTESFFRPRQRKPRAKPEDVRPARIVALRKQHNASIDEIVQLLALEKLSVSRAYVAKVLKAAGVEKLPRRPASQRGMRVLRGGRADRRALNLDAATFSTSFGGLFLFAFDLARMEGLFKDFPGSTLIPADCAMRSLLALKLWVIGRPSQVMADTLDPGLAPFTGLNVIPKRSTLTEYTGRCDFAGDFLHRWHRAANKLGFSLGGGDSFDLDFHTIPYHGDEALLEKHFVSKRSRQQRGIL